MNAAEIIEQIQHLPPAEQGKVIEFVQHLGQERPPVRYADAQAVRQAAREVIAENGELLKKLAQ